MLDHFPHLDESNIPLLQINRMALRNKLFSGGKDPRYGSDDPRSAGDVPPGEESMLIIDRSRGARQFLLEHKVERYRANHPYQKFPRPFRWSKQREGIAERLQTEAEVRSQRVRDRVVRQGGYSTKNEQCHTLNAQRASTAWCREECAGFFCPPQLCSEACFITKDMELGMSSAPEGSVQTGRQIDAVRPHIPLADAAAAQRAARGMQDAPRVQVPQADSQPGGPSVNPSADVASPELDDKGFAKAAAAAARRLARDKKKAEAEAAVVERKFARATAAEGRKAERKLAAATKAAERRMGRARSADDKAAAREAAREQAAADPDQPHLPGIRRMTVRRGRDADVNEQVPTASEEAQAAREAAQQQELQAQVRAAVAEAQAAEKRDKAASATKTKASDGVDMSDPEYELRCHAIADGAGIDDDWCRGICTQHYCPEKMCSDECIDEAEAGLLPIEYEAEDPADKIRRETEEARAAAEAAYPSDAADDIGAKIKQATTDAFDGETPAERIARETDKARADAEDAIATRTAEDAKAREIAKGPVSARWDAANAAKDAADAAADAIAENDATQKAAIAKAAADRGGQAGNETVLEKIAREQNQAAEAAAEASRSAAADEEEARTTANTEAAEVAAAKKAAAEEAKEALEEAKAAVAAASARKEASEAKAARAANAAGTPTPGSISATPLPESGQSGPPLANESPVERIARETREARAAAEEQMRKNTADADREHRDAEAANAKTEEELTSAEAASAKAEAAASARDEEERAKAEAASARDEEERAKAEAARVAKIEEEAAARRREAEAAAEEGEALRIAKAKEAAAEAEARIPLSAQPAAAAAAAPARDPRIPANMPTAEPAFAPYPAVPPLSPITSPPSAPPYAPVLNPVEASKAAAEEIVRRAAEARKAAEEANNAAKVGAETDNAANSAKADKEIKEAAAEAEAAEEAEAEAPMPAGAERPCRSMASEALKTHGITDSWCIKTCSKPDQCPLNVCSKDCKYKKIVSPKTTPAAPSAPAFKPSSQYNPAIAAADAAAAAKAKAADAAQAAPADAAAPADLAPKAGSMDKRHTDAALECTLTNGTVMPCNATGCRSMAAPTLVASGVDDAWCIETCHVGGCPYDVCSHECMMLSPEEDPDLGSAVAQLVPTADLGPSIATEHAPALPKVDPNHVYHTGWTLGRLASLFKYGEPTNNLSHAGFTFHGFDGTEDERRPWVPCTSAWCKPTPLCKWVNITHDKRSWPPNEPAYKNWTYYSHMIDRYGPRKWKNCSWRDTVWMSASIINAKQHHSISASGILFTPDKTTVLCSWPDDMSSLDKGCATDFTAQRPAHPMPFKPLELNEMLRISMNPKYMATSLYNEVLIDAQAYKDNLPQSIAAIVYFDDSPVADKVVAVHTYLQLLDEYNLTTSQLPLLKVARAAHLDSAGRVLPPNPGEIVVDESAGARAYLTHHSFEKFRKHMPSVVKDRYLDEASVRPPPDRVAIPGGTVKGGKENTCKALVPERVSDEWCTVNCLYSKMATAEAARAAERDKSRGEKNGGRRENSAAIDCPPEYCACPNDGIEHPAPADEQQDPLQQVWDKAAGDPFSKEAKPWLDNPDAVPLLPDGVPREDAFEQFRQRMFPRERHTTQRAAELIKDPFEELRRVARDPFEELRRVPNSKDFTRMALPN